MADATPVHSKTAPKKKPLSKDAQKIKAELAEIEANQSGEADVSAPVEPTTVKLDDGTVRKNN
jgi:hypothetical protein